ncbi:MAG: DUF3791 domain-containing protein [Candidatus Symbiothrix sp.]|jgi:hypothetical protein|nr:DUF3791 domain-containing protein [Candidatus Symbiothrix sp.]
MFEQCNGIIQPVEQFIIFSLEAYKAAAGLKGMQAFRDFEDYDVFSYLMKGYEVLHTQSKEYIVADIEEFIANRRLT